MSITIIVPEPGNIVGPGIVIQVQTDLPLDIGPGWEWQIMISTHESGQPAGMWMFIPASGPLVVPMLGQHAWTALQNGGQVIPDKTPVRLVAQLHDQNRLVVDSGSIPATYDANAMLWQQINQAQSAGGGLTSEQAAQLQRTDSNTQEMDVNWQQYVSVTLPSLQDVLNSIITGITTTIGEGASQIVATIGQRLAVVTQDFFQPYDVSGGETCDPVRFDASFARITGVTVLITQFPPEFRLVTPDGGWTFRDFAVLSFVRGGSLLERHGIHTLSYTVSPCPASVAVWNTGLELDILPGDYHINVDWAPGVCGRVVGEVLP